MQSLSVYKLIQAFVPDLFMCKFQENSIKSERIVYDKVQNKHFWQSRECNSTIDMPTLPVFKLILAFIPDLFMYKFQ